MKPRHYFCEYWRQSFWFCIGWSYQNMAAYLKKHHEYEPDLSQKGGSVFSIRADNGSTIYLVWTRKKHAPTIAHECVHAANALLESRGWKPQLDNDEPQAYLVEALMREALK